jgi:signal transduction histidine kinase
MLGSWRLRHKLGLAVGLAALLPVIAVSVVAGRLVLGGLEDGLKTQTDRALRVGLNLVLRQVQQAGAEAVQLAESAALERLLGTAPRRVQSYLEGEGDRLPPGLVEVADRSGRIIARFAAGDSTRVADLSVGDQAEAIKRSLAYERRVTLEVVGARRPGATLPAPPLGAGADAPGATVVPPAPTTRNPGGAPGDRLVMRASAPVVTEALALRGAVVVSLPLDDHFTDQLKAALAADVMIHSGAQPSASTFVGEGGRRLKGIVPPLAVAARVLGEGAVRQSQAVIEGREYALGYAPLQDNEGRRVGMLGIAVERQAIATAKRSALASVLLGAIGALVLALAIAGLVSRTITSPLGVLHKGAQAVARGELDHDLPEPASGDEIGELTQAFRVMTLGLKENQERLAARIREIMTLHEIGRAVSSVLSLDDVLKKIVGEVAGVLDANACVLLLAQDDGTLGVGGAVGVPHPAATAPLAAAAAAANAPLRIEAIEADGDLGPDAQAAGLKGSLLAVPLELKDQVLGVLLCTRPHDRPFTEADLRLVATFADQAAAALDNARLYERVTRFNEELEEKVRARTHELTLMNQELGRTLHDLQSTQTQLIHSERMAGLGLLVAGVAHEINSPAAAIRGAADNLADNVIRLLKSARGLGEAGVDRTARTRFLEMLDELRPKLQSFRLDTPTAVRRQARELAAALAARGLPEVAEEARILVECGAVDVVDEIVALGGPGGFKPLVHYLEQYTYVLRNSEAIRTAIRSISRIVGALKSYSHLDQEAVPHAADLHEGIENTLIILHNQLKYGILVTKRYDTGLPPVPVFVDEINQVWTNLLHNAVQALGGKGEITIETAREGEMAAVRVVDDGPGIPPHILSHIFEPFFTTKAKGEGTGLGLGIVLSIVQKHGGTVEVDSHPGRTCFTVRLPLAGPPLPVVAHGDGEGTHSLRG